MNQKVLLICKEKEIPFIGEYISNDYWKVDDANVTFRGSYTTVSIVAWHPIPEYKEIEEDNKLGI